MPQPGLIRKIVSLIPFCARSRSLINKLTTSQSSAVRGSQYSARYTSTDKMLQEEEFVGEGTSARTSLDVVSYGSKKRLQSKCAPVVKPRGAVGRKHRILHGGVALAYCVFTAGVTVVRVGKAAQFPSALHCGLPLERNFQNTDIFGPFISHTFPYFLFFQKKHGKQDKEEHQENLETFPNFENSTEDQIL